MDNSEIKNLIHKFDLIINKEKYFFELKSKENILELKISTEDKSSYTKEYTLEDLQQIAKYFKVFDSIEDAYTDLKQKFDQNNYTIS